MHKVSMSDLRHMWRNWESELQDNDLEVTLYGRTIAIMQHPSRFQKSENAIVSQEELRELFRVLALARLWVDDRQEEGAEDAEQIDRVLAWESDKLPDP